MGVKVVLHSFHRAVKHKVPFKIFFYALSFYNDAVIITNSFQENVSRFDNFELTAFENNSRRDWWFLFNERKRGKKHKSKQNF